MQIGKDPIGVVALGTASGAATVFFFPTLKESVVFSTISRCQPTYRLLDALRLQATPSTTLELPTTLSEQLTLSDAIGFIAKLLASDGLTLSDDLTGTVERTLLLAETLAMTSGVGVTLELAKTLMESLAFEEVVSAAQALTVQETLTLADAIASEIEATLQAQETLALASKIRSSFVLIASDTLALGDSLASTLEVLLTARDTLAFIGSLPLSDGNYQAWVMNAETLGMTTYTNYPFESMAELNGRLFGVRADGLFELTGQTDNGTNIDAVLRTGVLELWGGAEGSLPDAWLYVLADNTILLTVTTDRYGSRITDTYEVVPRVNEGTGTENLRWVELFQDTVGTHVQFEIRNVDGGDFTFKGAQIYPVALSTRGH